MESSDWIELRAHEARCVLFILSMQFAEELCAGGFSINVVFSVVLLFIFPAQLVWSNDNKELF